MKKVTMQLETLTCPSCLQKINNAVRGLNGVDKDSVNVMFNSSKVKFDYDNEVITVDQVKDAITKVGYEVLKVSEK